MIRLFWLSFILSPPETINRCIVRCLAITSRNEIPGLGQSLAAVSPDDLYTGVQGELEINRRFKLFMLKSINLQKIVFHVSLEIQVRNLERSVLLTDVDTIAPGTVSRWLSWNQVPILPMTSVWWCHMGLAENRVPHHLLVQQTCCWFKQ